MPDLLLSIVLDRSGSMEAVRDQTIASVNELLRSQAADEGRTYVSLTLFDTKPEMRHIMAPLEDVPLLNHASYRPGGWTALYDAVGNAISALDEAQARGVELPEKIMFVVQTDGHENSSTAWDRGKLFDLVKKKQDEGHWAFLFLGCDIDAYGIGGQIGMSAANTIGYSAAETANTYTVASNSARNFRTGQVTYDNLVAPPAPPSGEGEQG